MNFFEQQDSARRNARLLVVLFLAAVLLLILLANAAVAAFLFIGEDYSVYSGSRSGLPGFLSYFSWERFGGIGLPVTATVALVSLVKWIQLSTGGKVVAEAMGGERILPQTRDRAERRCLNVVEEMALAANMPVPPVYVMNQERGINAFAAGIVPADAVIAVTRGTLDHLERQELQGVIAHEFSHILNGDMRLNIRLAALLKGITFIGDVGHFIGDVGHNLLRSNPGLRASRSDDNDGATLLLLGLALWVLGLGLALWVLGWLGKAAAGFIKAAISRQKEYLADASAVQFTRDNKGIADALKVIGGYIPGSLVHASRAVEMSHIFFGQIQHRLWQLFATHPPLETRIRRLESDWNGEFIQRKPRHYPNPPLGPDAFAGLERASIVAATMDAAPSISEALKAPPHAEFEPEPADYEAATAEQEQLPLALVRHCHEPLGAHAVVCALLMSPQEETYQRQMAVLQAAGIRGLAELAHTLHPAVAALGSPRRLPLLELCLPALKSISPRQYRAFRATLLQLIQADARTELHEWCLYQLVRHYLDPEFIQVKPSRARHRTLDRVLDPLQITLSVLAHEGGGDSAAVFGLGARELGFTEMTPLPRENCSVGAFSRAVHDLADCYPLLKPRILKALTLAAGEEGRLSSEEKEIIAAMAAVMDCPSPALL